jgi:hypothetical protein
MPPVEGSGRFDQVSADTSLSVGATLNTLDVEEDADRFTPEVAGR